VAAAGGHHLLLIGSPGCGKTLLASRLPSLLPDSEEIDALQLAAITTVSGEGLDPKRWRQRPFRAPHHSASAAALVGGGNPPCPGEISLAHHGVLFLDELPEWNRSALETLREPLESGHIRISRAARSVVYPARFQLVAAMNRGGKRVSSLVP
jgi:magnesium chelatase family protein